MTQKISPFLEGKYGWDFGESGWNSGMDENLLKFSFLFDRNVDSIVSTLPTAVDGQAHYNTTDNRLYFAVGTTYYSAPVPKWFVITVRNTGAMWQFNGTSLVQLEGTQSLDTRLDSVEFTISTLGTAAYEDIGFFATQAELDVASANAAAYTDTLRTDLSNATDPLKGAGQLGVNLSLNYPAGTVGSVLDELQTVSINEVLLVPSQFSTIQAALTEVLKRRYDLNITVEVRLETGYQIPSGVDVRNCDLRNVRITSVDATVPLAVGFTGVAVSSDTFADGAIFYGENAYMPALACLIDAAGVGGPGYCVNQNSTGKVAGACGVINAGKFGLYVVNSSKCLATNANFSLANWGNRVTTNSTLCAPQINCSGAKLATYSGSNTTAAMDVSRGSVVYITGAIGAETNLTGSAGRGLAVRRSFVSATAVDTSNATLDGLNATTGSFVSFVTSKANNCGQDGISCAASWVDASGGVSAINAGRYNVLVQDGGKVCARNATLTGAATRGAAAVQGSDLTINGANCQKTSGVDSTTDIFVSDGSIIHASGATGGTNVTPLTLNAAGLIFK